MAVKKRRTKDVRNGADFSTEPQIVNGRGPGLPDVVKAPPRLQDETYAEGTDAAETGEWFDKDFATEEAFIQFWAKTYTADAEADKHNIDEAKEDLRFIYVDQWDEETRAEREEAGRPCITVNTLPQFIGQVVGDRRLNKTSIKVLPSFEASEREAEVRTGLIRSIENASRAERIYDAACEDQVGCGIGNFEVTMEYAYNDVFNQDIFIRQLQNPFAVTWDRFSKDPTGKDARHCFVEETMSKTLFEKEYPDFAVPTAAPMGENTWGEEDNPQGDVKIIAIWRMIDRPAKFALMADDRVLDVTDKPEAEWLPDAYIDEATNSAYVKEGKRTYAQRWLVTTNAVLEGPYELPLSRLPIIKVSGRVGRIGTKVYRFGLVRWARDPSLMRNYWRSIAVETLAMAPRATWLADHASVKGREQDFRDGHLSGDPLLVYNTGKNVPKRVDPPQLPGAVLNEAAMNTQDIKDVTGLHDASLGVRSNEVSGKAIMARQREGDVATVIYQDNLNQSILEAGCVVNELTPVCYDTRRVLKVMGPDEKPSFVKVNDPNDPEAPDITNAKYDVQLITGPSYTTQRMETAEAMLEMTKVAPELMGQALDILVEVQDWPGSERLVERFRKIIPAAQQEAAEEEAAKAEASGAPPAEPSQEEQMAAQMQQAQMELAAAQMQAQMAELEAQVKESQAKAAEAEAKAREAQLRIEIAEENIRKARADAEKAEANAIDAHEAIDRNQEAHDIKVGTQVERHDSHLEGDNIRRAMEVDKRDQQARHADEQHEVRKEVAQRPPAPQSSSTNTGGGSQSDTDSRPKGTR